MLRALVGRAVAHTTTVPRRLLSSNRHANAVKAMVHTSAGPRRLLSSNSRYANAGKKLVDELGELPASFRALLENESELPQAQQQVFCNREIRMDNVKVIGFDYDYTVASYKSTLQTLVFPSKTFQVVSSG